MSGSSIDEPAAAAPASRPPPMAASAVADPYRPPLEYAPPVAQSRTRTLLGGLAVSLVYAFGTAMIAMGLMMGLRNDRDAPTFVAIGVFAIIFATGTVITFWFARR